VLFIVLSLITSLVFVFKSIFYFNGMTEILEPMFRLWLTLTSFTEVLALPLKTSVFYKFFSMICGPQRPESPSSKRAPAEVVVHERKTSARLSSDNLQAS
jgi:hypothetical protein